ncbi:hypothetical protein STENM36S_07267 [Streptomyces tendae]
MTTATSTHTRSVVEELLRRIGAGDPEHIAELYAEQGDWRLDWPEAEHGRPATPWIRHRSTRADAAAHYRELAGHHVPEQAATEVERILVDGNDAVVLGEIRADRPPHPTPVPRPLRPPPHRRERPRHPAPRVRGQPRRRPGLRAAPRVRARTGDPGHRVAVTPRAGAVGPRPVSEPRDWRISSTLCLASPKSMLLFSRKNSGFCTPA